MAAPVPPRVAWLVSTPSRTASWASTARRSRRSAPAPPRSGPDPTLDDPDHRLGLSSPPGSTCTSTRVPLQSGSTMGSRMVTGDAGHQRLLGPPVERVVGDLGRRHQLALRSTTRRSRSSRPGCPGPGVQPSTSRARSVAATSTGGSPARRGPKRVRDGPPDHGSAAASTCRTLNPALEPRLQTSDAPGAAPARPLERQEMGVGQVHDVDVVPDGRAVGCRVVVAEERHRRAARRRPAAGSG